MRPSRLIWLPPRSARTVSPATARCPITCQGLDPDRQVDVAAAAEPDQADPLAGCESAPSPTNATMRRATSPAIWTSPTSEPSRVAIAKDWRSFSSDALSKGGVQAGRHDGRVGRPGPLPGPVHMDIEHVHEDTNTGQRGCPQAQLRRRDTGAVATTTPSAGLTTNRESAGVTRTGSRRSTHTTWSPGDRARTTAARTSRAPATPRGMPPRRASPRDELEGHHRAQDPRLRHDGEDTPSVPVEHHVDLHLPAQRAGIVARKDQMG